MATNIKGVEQIIQILAPYGKKRGWWCQLRSTKTNKQGDRVFTIGGRFGYWPCLQAPFIQLALGFWTFELWYGLPSYKRHGDVIY